MTSMRVPADSLSICDFSRICSFCYSASLKHSDRHSQTDKDLKGCVLFLRISREVKRKLRTEYYSLASGRKSHQESVVVIAGEKTNAAAPWPCRNRAKTPQLPGLARRRAGHERPGGTFTFCSDIRLRQPNPQCCKNISESLFSVQTLLKRQSQELWESAASD